MKEEHPLARVFAATIAAVDPAAATARVLRADAARLLHDGRPIWIAALGKAALAMLSGAAGVLGEAVAGGIVVAPVPGPVPPRMTLLLADHPVPGTRSEAAGRALLALAASVPPTHHLLALVSGGASALAAVPGTGITLAEKVARVKTAAAAGQPIQELNRLRSSMSAIKGGRLAARCQAPVHTVVVSDVVGDDPAIVGSGPTVGEAASGRARDQVVVASGIRQLAEAAAASARHLLRLERTEVVDSEVVGDVDEVATRLTSRVERELAQSRSVALVWTGEPTIRLGESPGRGGRARHLALRVAWHLEGVKGWTLLCAGSDGVDGTADATGAIVDGDTLMRVRAAGIDPLAALADCDSGTALAAAGDAFRTGPTGVNHADLMVAVVSPSVL